MKRFQSILRKNSSQGDSAHANGDSPEAEIARGVRLFCESGGPNNQGEEVLHLPGIVEQAESSPSAAQEAARVIRKFLSMDNSQRAYVQYNAVMLMRILTDNPGKTFTRNIDQKFISTVQKLLKDGKDMSVQQILRETLDTFQLAKKEDAELKPLIDMWEAYKAKMAKRGGFNPAIGATQPGSAVGHPQPFYPPPGSRPRQSSRHALPPPHELASRIEEARTSAKLLLQVVQSTPPEEVLGNDLLKEFVQRCQSASRSVQGYINSTDPAPDEDTLLTLIETNDQLSASLSRHQRAILQARKIMGQSQPQQQSQTPPTNGLFQQQSNPQSRAPGGPQITPGVGAQVVDPQAGYVAPVGPPPRLGMPQPQSRIENPFDDSNQAPAENGTVADGTKPGAATRVGHVDDDDEDDAPQQPRSYRF